jgi:hypothetical protein
MRYYLPLAYRGKKMHFEAGLKRDILPILGLLILTSFLAYEALLFYRAKQPAKLIVTPELARLNIGKSVKLKVTVLNYKGEKISPKVKFKSSNEDVLKVDSSGVVKAVAEGSARLRIYSGRVVKEYMIIVSPPFEVRGLINTPQTNGVIVFEVTKFLYDEEENVADVLVWIRNVKVESYEVKPEQIYLIDDKNTVYTFSEEIAKKRANTFQRKKISFGEHYAGLLSFQLKKGRKPVGVKFDDGINYPILIILEKKHQPPCSELKTQRPL